MKQRTLSPNRSRYIRSKRKTATHVRYFWGVTIAASWGLWMAWGLR